MTRYSDREDGVEDPVAYQDAEQVFPKPLGNQPAEYVRPAMSEILEFENQWPTTTGRKEAMIRATFNLSAIRYYQLLNSAIDDPVALELDPILVHRLQDQRTARVNPRHPTTTERRP